MSSLIGLLFGFAIFATYKVADTKGFDCILWGILGTLFLILALTLATISGNME